MSERSPAMATRAASPLRDAFDRAKREGRAALVPFVTAGDPDVSATGRILAALAEAGADIIELGVPFSDPVADGPAIQQSSQHALSAGFLTAQIFEVVAAFREQHAVPVILFTYINPVLAVGLPAFAERAQRAGADGAILVDVPFEESGTFRPAFESHGLDIISLVSPTTSASRLRRIVEGSSGFIYYVSMTGVTGRHLTGVESVAAGLAEIRSKTTLPIAVGFGVQSPDDVRALAPFADGVVVGSELVRRIDAAGPEDCAKVAGAFAAELRAATRR